jgi:hypothetical protein
LKNYLQKKEMNKHFIYPLVAGISLLSCQKDNLPVGPGIESTVAVNALSQSNLARIEFSKILSKAVYDSKELRNFIKEIAIEQFDNDYDVFYPFIKDKIVKDGMSFREILLQYTDNENTLKSIEASLPLLNIYVPDLTMFNDFNAEKWDTNDNDIVVTALNYESEQTFYGDGNKLFSLAKNEIPGFPCLIVKDNERLKQNIKVKGMSSTNYEFLDDVFNKKLNTKGSVIVDGVAHGYRDDNIVAPAQIVQQAFAEFGIDPIYWQRDYIYWGLSKTKPKNGSFNPQVREFIHKVRVNPNIFYTISDQPSDPKLTSFQHSSDLKDPVPWADVVRRVWTDGNFEFRFYIYKGKRSAGSNAEKPDIKNLSISPRDLFTVKKVKHTIKGGGIFHRDKHTYSIESINDLEGKWFTPNGTGIQLEQWDIAEESMTMTIFVEEFDPGEIEEKEITVSNKYSSSANFKLDLGLGGLPKKLVKLDLSFGMSSQKEETKVQRTKWTTTHTSDALGNATFYFSDPILKVDYWKDKPAVRIYDGYSVGTGSIDIMLLPRPI